MRRIIFVCCVAVIAVSLLTSCAKRAADKGILDDLAHPQGTSSRVKEVEVSQWSQFPKEYQRDVSVVTAGNPRGQGKELVVIAGTEIFCITREGQEYVLGYRQVIDRYISSAVVADLNGDGNEEVILAGATSPRWDDGVEGWIGVYHWRDKRFAVLAEVATDTMPIWSCALLNPDGQSPKKILASNGHNLYIYELLIDLLKRAGDNPQFAGSISTAQGQEKQAHMVWRSECGHSYGLYLWGQKGIEEVWRIDNPERWVSTIPSIGDVSGNGKLICAFQGRDGLLRLYTSSREVEAVPEELEPLFAEPERLAPPVLVDVDGDNRAELLMSKRTKVIIYAWPTK